MDFIIELLYIVPAVLFAISMHEFSHGYVSYKLGDPTPKVMGRISLNPLKHLDPVGTLCLIFFKFGWAKPVSVNPSYYKNKKLGMVLVAIAGPITNFLLAFIGIFLTGIVLKIDPSLGSYISEVLTTFFYFFSLINIGLGIFNLIPIPPLDGSKILGALLPTNIYFKYMKYEQYGTFVLMLFLFSGLLGNILSFAQTGIIDFYWIIVNFILFL